MSTRGAAPEGVVTFADGLPGFEACRQFIVVASEEIRPFTVVQGVDQDAPAFVAIDPRQLDRDYQPTLDRATLARLGATGEEPLLWLALVATREDGSATANLRAPLVINPAAMRGIQVLDADSRYAIDHPLQVA